MRQLKIKVMVEVDDEERELPLKKISDIYKLKDNSTGLVWDGIHLTCRETIEEIYEKIAETYAEEEKEDKNNELVFKMYCKGCGRYQSNFRVCKNSNNLICNECSLEGVHSPILLKKVTK